MTANTVNGSGNGARSGAQTLVLLAAPLNCLVLRALAGGPKQQAELRRQTGSPAQTTLRAQLKKLVEIGVVDKHRRNRFPGVLEYELTGPGRDLLFVAEVLERWLGMAPEEPLRPDSGAAKAATKALAEGWSTTMLRALAGGSITLTELDGIISTLSYPSLERRLAAMRLAGLVESQRGNGRGTPYTVSRWTREAVAPLAAAARWEQRHLSDTAAPIARLDAEAVFLLAIPLLRLQANVTGTCRMAAEILNSRRRQLAGVAVAVEGGTIVSCATHLNGDADAWALGTPAAWIAALVEADTDRLELGGDCRLARLLVEGLHRTLFGAPNERERI